MTTTETAFAPGVYTMSADHYHADPVPGGSLSSSGARRLLPPSCPALFRHEQLNGRAPKSTFDFGHAAHQTVLGNGPDIVTVDADDWRTKAAKQERDDAYAAGKTPLLPHDHDQITAMADALRQHPIAGALLRPDRGTPEQSLFWRDPVSGVMLRARLDWLPHPGKGRMIVADYKTTVSAEPSAIEKAIYNFGYHQQADWYLDGVQTLNLADDPAFVFIFQEKTPPYIVTVTELSTDALMWGRTLNRKAIDTYRKCVDTGRWPGYADDDVVLSDLPGWAVKQYETAQDRGDYDIEGDT